MTDNFDCFSKLSWVPQIFNNLLGSIKSEIKNRALYRRSYNYV